MPVAIEAVGVSVGVNKQSNSCQDVELLQSVSANVIVIVVYAP